MRLKHSISKVHRRRPRSALRMKGRPISGPTLATLAKFCGKMKVYRPLLKRDACRPRDCSEHTWMSTPSVAQELPHDMPKFPRTFEKYVRTFEPRARTFRVYARTFTPHARTLPLYARTFALHARTLPLHARTLARHARTARLHARRFRLRLPVPQGCPRRSMVGCRAGDAGKFGPRDSYPFVEPELMSVDRAPGRSVVCC